MRLDSKIDTKMWEFFWILEDLKKIYLETYNIFKDIDFIDEGGVILDFALLDSFNSELFLGLPMLCQVNHTETTRGQLRTKVVFLLDVASVRINKDWLTLRAGTLGSGARNMR